MTSINDLLGLTHPLRRILGEEKIERLKTKEAKGRDSKDSSIREFSEQEIDKVSISGSAKTLQTSKIEVTKYVNQIKSLFNLDEESLQEIKRKIERGYYEGPDVITKIINDIIVPPPYVDIITTPVETSNSKVAKEEYLEGIKSKIEHGEYFKDEVTDSIIEKLMDSDYI